MPILKNVKHEAFAQSLSQGLNADDAYQKAGYKSNRGNASTLKANQSILDRVAELQSRAAEKAEWTSIDRLAALRRISDNAEKEDPRVSVSAIGEANKMQGSHAPTKSELSGKDGGPIVIASPADKLKAYLDGVAKRGGTDRSTSE